MIVEDQTGALREVELRRQHEREELGRHGRLGEAAERAERRHTVARLDLGTLGRAAHHSCNLAARHERQRRFELVLAARLQHLGERDPGGVHVDHDARARGERMRGLGLSELQERERAVGTTEVDDLDCLHGGDYVRSGLAGGSLNGEQGRKQGGRGLHR